MSIYRRFRLSPSAAFKAAIRFSLRANLSRYFRIKRHELVSAPPGIVFESLLQAVSDQPKYHELDVGRVPWRSSLWFSDGLTRGSSPICSAL